MSENDPTYLTTATVNRLLRPLRNRCNALLKMATTHSRNAAAVSSNHYTYSSRATSQTPYFSDGYPLSILPPPHKLSSRIPFTQHHKNDLEFSRLIYIIRDSFRHIVIKTGLHLAGGRSIGLSSICATMIGRNIQGWYDIPENSESDSDLDFLDELYEAVPIQYRGWTVVSHSLQIIMESGPRHPTLLTVLLDVALEHHLKHQAPQLLHALFFVALRPKPNRGPSLCHSAHSRFLLEHLERWMAAGFTVSAFTKTLVDVLSGVDDFDAWNSRAVEQLSRRLYAVDFPSFIWLAIGMANFILKQPRKGERVDQPNALEDLHKRLCQWVDMTAEHRSLFCSPGIVDVSPDDGDLIFTLILATGFHTTSSEDCGFEMKHATGLDDCGAALASRWLVCFNRTSSATQTKIMIQLLRNAVPRAPTFRKMVEYTFSNHTLSVCQKVLKSYAKLFREKSLVNLEASLWACALHYVESSDAGLQGTVEYYSQFKAYRQKIMELVDDAESRLFGKGPMLLTPPPEHDGIGTLDFTTRCRSSSFRHEWEWEPVLGCWVRKQSRGQHRDRTQCSIGDVLPKALRSKGGLDVVHHHRGQRRVVIPKSKGVNGIGSINFTSLIADAVSRRTNLHVEAANMEAGKINGGENRIKRPRFGDLCMHAQDHVPSDDVLNI